uniref:F-box domain-containing protein n=1 Tax=Quercus lobata TaxID=97700 RepID=A0A7N2LPT3_QUELO
MPPRTVKRGAGLAGPKRTTRGTRGAQKAQDPPPEEVAVLVAAPPKRSRNSSDIAGKRDLFDSLPDELVISILRKLSSSATYPSDFANVLLTYVLLFFLMKNKFRPFHRSFNRNCGLNFISKM